MFQVYDWSAVILHLDGDSFFASVMQATHPHLKGKPIVTGSERGVATAISPEAKKFGITRATSIQEVKRKFPQVIIVSSDYQLYGLFQKKMFAILRRYSPIIEEYSIDEAFADLKGLRRPLHMTYEQIGRAVKHEIETSLNISISVGISLTKSLAKIASNFKKPSGFVMIPGRAIQNYLSRVAIEDVWGIGPNTGAYLRKLGITTALQFAAKPEEFVLKNLNKTYFEIWQELRGDKVYDLSLDKKTTYQSITRSHTFASSRDPEFLWSQVVGHIEDAFEEARQFQYHVGFVSIYLKSQQFYYHKKELKLLKKIQYPHLIKSELRQTFNALYQKGVLYRTAGCTISDLAEQETVQNGLFEDTGREEKIKKIYPLVEGGKVHFGSALYEGRQLVEKKPKHFGIPIVSVNEA